MQYIDKQQRRELELWLANKDVPGWRVARAMGLSPSTFSAWKRGVHAAPADFIARARKAAADLSPDASAA